MSAGLEPEGQGKPPFRKIQLRCATNGMAACATNTMLGYLRGLGAVRPAAGPGPAADAGHLLERLGAFLADERGLADKTRGAHLDSARRFLAE